MRLLIAVSLVVLAGCGKSEPASPGSPSGKSEAPSSARGSGGIAVDEPEETTGLIGRGETDLTLIGKPLEVGDTIPDFDLAALAVDPDTGAPEHVSSQDLKGKVVVLSVVPSIDTRVCEKQTGVMAEKQVELPEGVELLTISRDLPFAQQRFLELNQFQTPMASDYRGGSFGEKWGLAVKETGLLARSVWVIDDSGVIRYREIVPDQSTEPNYDALWDAVRKTAGG